MSSEDVAALASRSRARTKICATALAEPRSASACGACTDAAGAAGSPGSDFWPCSAARSSSTLHAVTETTAKRGKSPATNSVPVTAVRLVCTNPSGRSSKNRPFGSVTNLAPAGCSAVRRASAGASVSTARRGRVGWVKATAAARSCSGTRQPSPRLCRAIVRGRREAACAGLCSDSLGRNARDSRLSCAPVISSCACARRHAIDALGLLALIALGGRFGGRWHESFRIRRERPRPKIAVRD